MMNNRELAVARNLAEAATRAKSEFLAYRYGLMDVGSDPERIAKRVTKRVRKRAAQEVGEKIHEQQE